MRVRRRLPLGWFLGGSELSFAFVGVLTWMGLPVALAHHGSVSGNDPLLLGVTSARRGAYPV